MSAWQDISTAPKDGSFVWVLDFDLSVVKARWFKKGDNYAWREFARGGLKCHPTQWHPLLEAPLPPADAKPVAVRDLNLSPKKMKAMTP